MIIVINALNRVTRKTNDVNVNHIVSIEEGWDPMHLWERTFFKDINNDMYEWPGPKDLFIQKIGRRC